MQKNSAVQSSYLLPATLHEASQAGQLAERAAPPVARSVTFSPSGRRDPAWLSGRMDEFAALVDAGHSATSIAQKMDTTRNAVMGVAHRRGFRLKGRVLGHYKVAARPSLSTFPTTGLNIPSVTRQIPILSDHSYVEPRKVAVSVPRLTILDGNA